MPTEDSGFDALFDALRAEADDVGEYELEVRNVAPHAQYVEDHDAIDLIPAAFVAEAAAAEVAPVLEDPRPIDGERVTGALDRAGARVVEDLQGFTQRLSDDGRPLHPAGFADVTGGLADSYEHEARRL